MERSSLPKIITIALVITCLFAVVSPGCQSQPSGEIEVRVVVTQDFGSEVMLDKSVRLANGANAVDALGKVATVGTKYGGGFIESINGVRSQYPETNKDWFFYVNGMSAKVGALDYKLCNNDIGHWDFHDWGFHAFVPAIIGDFPQPFSGGYQGEIAPTIVIYDRGFQEAARNLVNKLKELGVESVSSRSVVESSYSKKYSNLILLGTEEFDLISELNKNYDKLGFFICFDTGKVAIFDSQGNRTQHKSNCGPIQATQSLWNPKGIGVCENVVWMVSGTDEAGVKNAVDTLINHYADTEFQYAFAVAIANGEIIKVP